MTQNLLKFAFGLLSALVVCSCGDEPLDLGIGTYSEHYITSYLISAKNQKFVQINDSTFFLDTRNLNSKELARESSDAPYSTLYYRLCEKYKDTYYNQKTNWSPVGNVAFAEDLKEISVVSDHDFNEVKAGESLASKLILVTSNAAPYIDSGYSLLGNWNDVPYEDRIYSFSEEGYHPVIKPLTDVTTYNLKLVNVLRFCMRFTETPDIKEHVLTITMKMSNISGEMKTYSFNCDFKFKE